MASSSSSTASAPPPPPTPTPTPAKKAFLRRILPVLLVANAAVGVYILTRSSKKQSSEKHEKPAAGTPAATVMTKEATGPEKKVSAEATAPVKVLPPIPENEQRELFKWILEEKRKVKPKDKSEKKKIDEEKALLKEFIRVKSIPSL